jgi:hypothetical protein
LQKQWKRVLNIEAGKRNAERIITRTVYIMVEIEGIQTVAGKEEA